MNGKALKQFRRLHGWRQIQVAKASGIFQSKLSLIENEWIEPRPDEIEKIRAAFKLLAEKRD